MRFIVINLVGLFAVSHGGVLKDISLGLSNVGRDVLSGARTFAKDTIKGTQNVAEDIIDAKLTLINFKRNLFNFKTTTEDPWTPKTTTGDPWTPKIWTTEDPWTPQTSNNNCKTVITPVNDVGNCAAEGDRYICTICSS